MDSTAASSSRFSSMKYNLFVPIVRYLYSKLFLLCFFCIVFSIFVVLFYILCVDCPDGFACCLRRLCVSSLIVMPQRILKSPGRTTMLCVVCCMECMW
jgi:hypothetical protein